MKTILCATFAIALVACGQGGHEAASATDSSATTATTSTVVSETTATPAADTAATTDTTGSTGTASTTASTATTSSAAAAPATASAAAPAKVAKKEKKPVNPYENKVAELHTTKGEIDIRFFPDVAPNHVKNFIDLAEKGFYNGTKFHRVIAGFMIQGGDPNTVSGSPSTWGMGGSDKKVPAEFNRVHHARGIVSMARSQDPNSASSQFFIVVGDSGFLDRQYTVFGQVTKGMEVADQIVNVQKDGNDRPKDPVTIESIKIRDAKSDDEKGPAPQ